MTKTRSMRGEIVDFDLIRVKQQIASAPKTINVKFREDFIERRLRKRIKRTSPLTEIKDGVAQTPQQPIIVNPSVQTALKELPKTEENNKEVEQSVVKRKKINRRIQKKED